MKITNHSLIIIKINLYCKWCQFVSHLQDRQPIYKKGLKEDLGNYRPVSLTSVLGKVMEQISLSTITQHMQDNQGIRPSQRGFMTDRSCSTNLICLYNKVTHLVG